MKLDPMFSVLQSSWTSFLAGLFLSFVGSLPPGIISLSVVRTTLRQGYRSAWMLSLGASLVEILQAGLGFFLAVSALSWVNTIKWLSGVSAVILIAAGLYVMFAPAKPPSAETGTARSYARAFVRGVWVSALNMIAIPYWFFYAGYLYTTGMFHGTTAEIGMVSLGAGIGTFAGLILYAQGSRLAIERWQFLTRWLSRLSGAILLGLGLYQAWQVLGG